ncbi:MAG: precorrin-8X methylmutase [Deltaproteobacteria bacterium]|nr:precorrin-8X methylmutase [Deltaproteobacteria bacterium]MBT7810493.1 precorrin-8X methylmutase [Deltaproteobacteria bacterium]
MTGDYLRDPKAIYRQSFATIRREADLSNFPEDIANIAVRLIHACGMTDIVNDIIYSLDAASSAREALKQGAPVLCDARMVAEGIISSRLPANNEVLCWNKHPECTTLANKMGTTLSAAAVEFWRPQLAGAIVVVGNAPTTLFRLLEVLAEGVEPPAVIFGFPVGFVGAAESKELLVNKCRKSIPFMTLSGRRGGSAIAAAAVNAVAKHTEI